ncbi:MAG: ATP-binding protein [bacterium]|nr:ATP-binding protein [bacterium]
MPEHDCPICGGEGWIVVTDGDGGEVVRPCECAAAVHRRDMLGAAQVPERYEHRTLENFSGPLNPSQKRALNVSRQYAADFPEVEGGLIFSGGWGVGKTHLAVGVLKVVAAKGHSVLFADSRELIGEIRSAYVDNQPIVARRLVERVLSVELLLLDDLGAYNLTSWVLDTFADILTRRFNACLPVLITTNYPDKTSAKNAETLSDRIGPRLRSRLYEMCRHLHLIGDDYRQDMLADSFNPDD